MAMPSGYSKAAQEAAALAKQPTDVDAEKVDRLENEKRIRIEAERKRKLAEQKKQQLAAAEEERIAKALAEQKAKKAEYVAYVKAQLLEQKKHSSKSRQSTMNDDETSVPVVQTAVAGPSRPGKALNTPSPAKQLPDNPLENTLAISSGMNVTNIRPATSHSTAAGHRPGTAGLTSPGHGVGPGQPAGMPMTISQRRNAAFEAEERQAMDAATHHHPVDMFEEHGNGDDEDDSSVEDDDAGGRDGGHDGRHANSGHGRRGHHSGQNGGTGDDDADDVPPPPPPVASHARHAAQGAGPGYSGDHTAPPTSLFPRAALNPSPLVAMDHGHWQGQGQPTLPSWTPSGEAGPLSSRPTGSVPILQPRARRRAAEVGLNPHGQDAEHMAVQQLPWTVMPGPHGPGIGHGGAAVPRSVADARSQPDSGAGGGWHGVRMSGAGQAMLSPEHAAAQFGSPAGKSDRSATTKSSGRPPPIPRPAGSARTAKSQAGAEAGQELGTPGQAVPPSAAPSSSPPIPLVYGPGQAGRGASPAGGSDLWDSGSRGSRSESRSQSRPRERDGQATVATDTSHPGKPAAAEPASGIPQPRGRAAARAASEGRASDAGSSNSKERKRRAGTASVGPDPSDGAASATVRHEAAWGRGGAAAEALERQRELLARRKAYEDGLKAQRAASRSRTRTKSRQAQEQGDGPSDAHAAAVQSQPMDPYLAAAPQYPAQGPPMSRGWAAVAADHIAVAGAPNASIPVMSYGGPSPRPMQQPNYLPAAHPPQAPWPQQGPGMGQGMGWGQGPQHQGGPPAHMQQPYPGPQYGQPYQGQGWGMPGQGQAHIPGPMPMHVLPQGGMMGYPPGPQGMGQPPAVYAPQVPPAYNPPMAPPAPQAPGSAPPPGVLAGLHAKSGGRAVSRGPASGQAAAPKAPSSLNTSTTGTGLTAEERALKASLDAIDAQLAAKAKDREAHALAQVQAATEAMLGGHGGALDGVQHAGSPTAGQASSGPSARPNTVKAQHMPHGKRLAATKHHTPTPSVAVLGPAEMHQYQPPVASPTVPVGAAPPSVGPSVGEAVAKVRAAVGQLQAGPPSTGLSAPTSVSSLADAIARTKSIVAHARHADRSPYASYDRPPDGQQGQGQVVQEAIKPPLNLGLTKQIQRIIVGSRNGTRGSSAGSAPTARPDPYGQSLDDTEAAIDAELERSRGRIAAVANGAHGRTSHSRGPPSHHMATNYNTINNNNNGGVDSSLDFTVDGDDEAVEDYRGAGAQGAWRGQGAKGPSQQARPMASSSPGKALSFPSHPARNLASTLDIERDIEGWGEHSAGNGNAEAMGQGRAGTAGSQQGGVRAFSAVSNRQPSAGYGGRLVQGYDPRAGHGAEHPQYVSAHPPTSAPGPTGTGGRVMVRDPAKLQALLGQ